MGQDITISPEELYYLGTLLQAKYIDYAYVAAMDDVGQNYRLFEKESKASLISSGILDEDFCGNLIVREDVKALLTAVFFGEFESTISICEIRKGNTVSVRRFHFLDSTITMVKAEDKKLVLRQISSAEIAQIIEGLLSDGYCCEKKTVADIPRDKITRFFAFKNNSIGVSAVVKTYIEADGVIHQETPDGNIETVLKEDFISTAEKIIGGEKRDGILR